MRHKNGTLVRGTPGLSKNKYSVYTENIVPQSHFSVQPLDRSISGSDFWIDDKHLRSFQELPPDTQELLLKIPDCNGRVSPNARIFFGLSENDQTELLADYAQHRNGVSPINVPQVREMIDLYNEDFKPLDFLIDRLLARGHFAILGGRPKSGKSWLVLQLAKAIDTGDKFLDRNAKQGRVIYAALEDGERRLHQRLHLLKWKPKNSAALFSIAHFDGEGGVGPGLVEVEALTADCDLLIIDTLIATLSGKANENDNSQMGAIVKELSHIAHDTDTAIVLVHHTNKGNADDPFDLLRGASSLRGAYDLGMMIVRKQGEREAILYVEARDFDASNSTIRQKEDGAGWEYVGSGLELTNIRVGRRVVEAMVEHGDGKTAAELAELLGVSIQTVRNQLNGAEKRGLVRKEVSDQAGTNKPAYHWYLEKEIN